MQSKSQKFIVLIIAIIFTMAILIITSYLLFYHQPENFTDGYATIVTSNPQTVTIIATDSTQPQDIAIDRINYQQFDPHLQTNEPVASHELYPGEKIIIKKQNNDYQFILTPPVQLFGQVQSIDQNIYTIIANGQTVTLQTTDQTVFLDPNKYQIDPESITIGQFIFIYSDYSAYPGQTQNIPTASIQIINKE